MPDLSTYASTADKKRATQNRLDAAAELEASQAALVAASGRYTAAANELRPDEAEVRRLLQASNAATKVANEKAAAYQLAIMREGKIDAELAAELAEVAAKPGIMVDGIRTDTGPPAALANTGLVGARKALAKVYAGVTMRSDREREESWSGMLAAVLGGQPLHPAMLAATSSEGIAGDGGYFVAPDISQTIFERAMAESVFVRAGIRVEPMRSAERWINAVDDADETGDLHAGLEAAWRAEGESFGEMQKLKTRRVKLVAKKMGLFAAVTNELDEDSGTFSNTLDVAIIRTLAKMLDRTILSAAGGAGTPQGILSAAATKTVAKQVGQAPDTFTWTNAADMFVAMAPDSLERAIWIYNPKLFPQLGSMVINAGTSGFAPPSAFQSDGRGGYQMLGRPAIASSRLPLPGNLGDIIFFDPSAYVLGLRRGFAIEKSTHALFTTDQLAVRGSWRGDAQPMVDSVQTLEDGVTTVSPFVILEAR